MTTQADIDAEISVALAGRAAERLILGNVSTGAGGPADSDLARATWMATAVEVSWGLGDAMIWRSTPEDAAKHVTQDPSLRARVQAHLDRADAIAFEHLSRLAPCLLRLADALHERSILTRTELDALLGGACGPAISQHRDAISTGAARQTS